MSANAVASHGVAERVIACNGMTPTPSRPRVISCGGGSTAAALAAEIARGLELLVPPATSAAVGGEGQPTIALDGCASACSSRLAAARGERLVAALSLADLGVDDVENANPQELATLAAARLRRKPATAPPPRPYRYAGA